MLPSQTQTLAIPPDRKTKYGKWFIIHILNSITNLPSLNHSKCNYYRINAYSNFRYTIRMTHRLKKLIRKMLPASLFRSLQPKYHGLLAVLAHYWYGKPSDKLVVIGVTGTKGKTSTAHIIYQLLNALGASCGLISTAVIDEGKGQQMNWFRMTQMSGPITHRLLSHIVKSGKRYVVVEVSSEGLAQHRHLGINFDIAVFTNLTPDHIDAHGSFQAYKEAKAILFKAIGALQITKEKKAANPSTAKTIISNLDSEHGLYYLNFRADAHITYAIDNQTAVLVAKNLEIKTKGSTFEIRGSRFTLDLPGKFNVYNTLAAIGVAHSLGFKMETIAGAAKKLTPIPGRMEVLQTEPFTVVVDYAHEKASMTALYDTVQKWQHKKIIQVFGATGGVRDKSRRTDLGKIAGKLADIAIITDEDPFDEDPQAIIHDIANAAVAEGKVIKETLFRNPNRREAIRKALTLAQPGDLVLITGKGAEQKIARANGQYEDWDDRVVTREEIEQLRSRAITAVTEN